MWRSTIPFRDHSVTLRRGALRKQAIQAGLATGIRSSEYVRRRERNSGCAEVPEACIHRISVGELGEVSAKDPLNLADASGNVTGAVIQNEVDMNAWIAAE